MNLGISMAEEPEVEQPEATIPDEELELELEPDDTEDVEALKTRAEKATNFARQVLARAKKAEEENKELKKPKDPIAPVVSPQPNVEETVLLANGMPEELLAQLKKVAQVQGVSLIKAQADPIFVAVKEKFEKDQKQKQAALGVSRGSGATKPKVDFNTPGLTREQHKEMALKAMES